MSTPTVTRVAAAAALTTGAVLLAGCAAPTAGAGAPATGFDKTTAQSSLLTADEVGSGYAEFPLSMLDKLGDRAGGWKPGEATVQPQACLDAFTAAKAMVGKPEKGAAVAVKKGSSMADVTVVGEAIAPTVTGVDALTDPALLTTCQSFTVTMGDNTATVTLTPIQSPTYGDKTTVVKVAADGSGQGKSISVTTVLSLVEKGDKLLAVSVLAPTAAADGIESIAADTTATAYAKAADFLAS